MSGTITGLEKAVQLVDFVMEFNGCNTSEALQKIASFHQQKTQNLAEKFPFQIPEKTIKNVVEGGENRIIITGVKQPITDPSLCTIMR